jgi:broad specificity phosphatase PhoE
VNDQPLRLTLVQHAVTVWNLEQRWQGWSDVALGAMTTRHQQIRLAQGSHKSLICASKNISRQSTIQLASFHLWLVRQGFRLERQARGSWE